MPDIQNKNNTSTRVIVNVNTERPKPRKKRSAPRPQPPAPPAIVLPDPGAVPQTFRMADPYGSQRGQTVYPSVTRIYGGNAPVPDYFSVPLTNVQNTVEDLRNDVEQELAAVGRTLQRHAATPDAVQRIEASVAGLRQQFEESLQQTVPAAIPPAGQDAGTQAGVQTATSGAQATVPMGNAGAQASVPMRSAGTQGGVPPAGLDAGTQAALSSPSTPRAPWDEISMGLYHLGSQLDRMAVRGLAASENLEDVSRGLDAVQSQVAGLPSPHVRSVAGSYPASPTVQRSLLDDFGAPASSFGSVNADSPQATYNPVFSPEIARSRDVPATPSRQRGTSNPPTPAASLASAASGTRPDAPFSKSDPLFRALLPEFDAAAEASRASSSRIPPAVPPPPPLPMPPGPRRGTRVRQGTRNPDFVYPGDLAHDRAGDLRRKENRLPTRAEVAVLVERLQNADSLNESQFEDLCNNYNETMDASGQIYAPLKRDDGLSGVQAAMQSAIELWRLSEE